MITNGKRKEKKRKKKRHMVGRGVVALVGWVPYEPFIIIGVMIIESSTSMLVPKKDPTC